MSPLSLTPHRESSSTVPQKSIGRSGSIGLVSCLMAAFFFGILPANAKVSPDGKGTRQYAQVPEPTEETPRPEADTPEEARFSCAFVDGEYTVMYHPQSQPGQSYAWAKPMALGGGWTPERRCNEIARRLEFYRPDGLVELGTGIENEYDIICVTTQADSSCRIVLTVPPGQDPQQTRDLVFENIVTADSGQSTAAVSALTASGEELDLLEEILGEEVLGIDWSDVGGSRGNPSSRINLQPFLDAADGGTGEMLEGGISMPSNPKLNPENFR